MNAQGKHRTMPRESRINFTQLTHADLHTLNMAIMNLELKGYEVRALRIHVEDHGHKVQVVLHISPGPAIYKSGQPDTVGDNGWSGKYHNQNVGTTRRRNLKTLLDYVEGLPSVVQREDGPVGSASGGEGVHEDV